MSLADLWLATSLTSSLISLQCDVQSSGPQPLLLRALMGIAHATPLTFTALLLHVIGWGHHVTW
jgi:hypothetical protein